MVLQNYQNFTEMTSNMIYIVAFGVGLKCPRKIHLNTQLAISLKAELKLKRLTIQRINNLILGFENLN